MRKKRKKDRKMVREILGLILIALSVFLIISIFNYHIGDPAPFEFGWEPDNMGGLIGAWLSAFLLKTLGLGAFIIPIFLIIFSVHLFKKGGIKGLPVRLLYGLFIFLSLVILLDIFFGHKKVFYYDTVFAGGLLGNFIADRLIDLFYIYGAVIFSCLVLVLFTLLLIGITPGEASLVLVRFFSRLYGLIRKGLAPVISKWRQRTRPIETGWEKGPEQLEIVDKRQPRVIDVVPISGETKPTDGSEVRFSFGGDAADYVFPPIELLTMPDGSPPSADRDYLIEMAKVLEKKLSDFGIKGRVTEVRPGPVITMFEYEPATGERINKISALAGDLAMAMSAMSVRIVAPIPGKSVVGFEIPNKDRELVRLREIIGIDRFSEQRSKLVFGLGKDIFGLPEIADLSKMPHLLIAGATGAGKSVFINSLIISILFNATPQEVRFLLIDPKMLELSHYQGIPHLLLPVITDSKEAAVALRWVVEEMERRYSLMAELGVKNISGYNRKLKKMGDVDEKPPDDDTEKREKMPYVVVIIDELSDLMMTSSREVEESITRLAQMARASGIHLIVATQRPSVNVLTGIIKANFPARISFQVSSKVDSRTILDMIGAENLLGDGDMLFVPPATSRVIRVHGAYISEEEITRVVGFVKEQGKPQYEEVDLKSMDEVLHGHDDIYDEKYDEAVRFVAETGKASISLIQRQMRIGYNRAARIIEKMEEEGVVGPSDGVKPREVLIEKI